jgi:hypothetical protein
MRSALGPMLILLLLTLSSSCATALGRPDSDASNVAQHVPSWMDQAIFYEIFPRAFSPAGTLNGVTARLDNLQQLGVNTLWLMPIHPIGKVKKLGTYGSMYAVRDYYAVDPDLGTKADLLRLVQAAHERHMRVILDEVPDHTSWDSVMMSHPAYYKRDAAGKVLYPRNWTDVAALNYANPELRKYMVDMFSYWLKTFGLDGFRCDDAGDVPTIFWDEASTALRAIRPDVLMLAEASQPDLLRQDFNVDYAWPLLETMNQAIMQGKPASAVRDVIDTQRARFPSGSWHMLVSDDHDTRRAIARYGAQGAHWCLPYPALRCSTTAWKSAIQRPQQGRHSLRSCPSSGRPGRSSVRFQGSTRSSSPCVSSHPPYSMASLSGFITPTKIMF